MLYRQHSVLPRSLSVTHSVTSVTNHVKSVFVGAKLPGFSFAKTGGWSEAKTTTGLNKVKPWRIQALKILIN